MPLVIVVVGILIVVGIWRARATRRLSMEESVDRYRRTLSAVHDATVRSGATDNPTAVPLQPAPAFDRSRGRSARHRWPRAASADSRRALIIGALAVVTVVAIAVVVAATRGTSNHPSTAPTTTIARTTTTVTRTTRPAPTTTVALVRPADATGTTFAIAKPSYQLALAATTGQCWVDVRDTAGHELFTGVLAPGPPQSVTAGTATIRLGNPRAATLTVDGTPVPFTTVNGSPVTLHLQAAAS